MNRAVEVRWSRAVAGGSRDEVEDGVEVGDAIMNAKLVLKSLVIVLVLALLVLMGMNNRGLVDFVLPPLIPRRIQQPAALMYFAFFAVGFLTGTLVWAGSGKKKGSGSGRASGDRK